MINLDLYTILDNLQIKIGHSSSHIGTKSDEFNVEVLYFNVKTVILLYAFFLCAGVDTLAAKAARKPAISIVYAA